MRRRAVGQSKRAAQTCHRQLNDTWGKWSTALADKERPIRRKTERTERSIIGNCPGDLRKDRDHSRLVAFSGDDQGFGGRAKAATFETERFGQTQAGTVKESQHCRIARYDPGLARFTFA